MIDVRLPRRVEVKSICYAQIREKMVNFIVTVRPHRVDTYRDKPANVACAYKSFNPRL